MNKLMASMLLGFMKMIVTSEVMDDIVAFVKEAADLNISGEDKKARVKEALGKLKTDVNANIAKLSGNVINLAIEVAVAWVNAHVDQGMSPAQPVEPVP